MFSTFCIFPAKARSPVSISSCPLCLSHQALQILFHHVWKSPLWSVLLSSILPPVYSLSLLLMCPVHTSLSYFISRTTNPGRPSDSLLLIRPIFVPPRLLFLRLSHQQLCSPSPGQCCSPITDSSRLFSIFLHISDQIQVFQLLHLLWKTTAGTSESPSKRNKQVTEIMSVYFSACPDVMVRRSPL